jgi:tetratricopeptide (TPR) repeat protein
VQNATQEIEITKLINEKKFQAASRLSERLPTSHPLRLAAKGLESLHIKCDYNAACTNLRRANKQHPRNVFIVVSLAEALTQSGKVSKASELIQSTLKILPNNPVLEVQLAFSLAREGRYARAIDTLTVSVNSDRASHIGARAYLYFNQDEFGRAKELYQLLTLKNPTNAEAFFNLGASHLRLKEHIKAEIALKESQRLGCKRPELLSHLGIALEEQNKPEEASKYLIQAINLAEPGRAVDATYHLSLIYLRTGKLKQGFDLYDARFFRSGKRAHNPPKDIPWWDGQPFSGKLILWSEQGIGDHILYTRTFKQLGDYLEGSIDCFADPRLLHILSANYPGINFWSEQDPDWSRYDFHLPTGSIPRVLLARDQKPQWLAPKTIDRDGWFSRFVNSRELSRPLRIGISWFSSNTELPGKNIDPHELAKILNSLNRPIQLVNLQYDQKEADLQAISELTNQDIERWDAENKLDIDGLYETINGLDLVISVSNTNVHLAGLANVPAIMLASKYSGRLWYWEQLDDHGNSRWYPSVKVVTQKTEGDWSSTMPRIKEIINDQ